MKPGLGQGEAPKNSQSPARPVSPRRIFWLDFPDATGNGSKPPYIGRHFGVVLEVLPNSRLLVIYGQSAPTQLQGANSQEFVDPNTGEGKKFGSVLSHRTYFRADSTVVCNASLLGEHLGTVSKEFFLQLLSVGKRGKQMVIDVANFVLTDSTAPLGSPRNPG